MCVDNDSRPPILPIAGASIDAKVKHDLTVYPGAPHSFFDRKQTEFQEASTDAWKRAQSVIRSNTKAA